MFKPAIIGYLCGFFQTKLPGLNLASLPATPHNHWTSLSIYYFLFYPDLRVTPVHALLHVPPSVHSLPLFSKCTSSVHSLLLSPMCTSIFPFACTLLYVYLPHCILLHLLLRYPPYLYLGMMAVKVNSQRQTTNQKMLFAPNGMLGANGIYTSLV